MATIAVTGYGEVAVPPDEAVVDLTITARGDSPGKALASVADRARSMVAVMDELGVPQAKRTTSGVWTNEEIDPEIESLRGSYHAGERLTVAVPPDLVGQLLDAAVSRAEAQVEGPHLVVEGGEGGGFHPVRRTASFAPLEAGPPIEASQASVSATVSITFEAEPA